MSSPPVIVFLHGFLGVTQEWLPLCSYLPSSLRVHFATLPGHGKEVAIEPATKRREAKTSQDPIELFFTSLRETLPKETFPLSLLVGYSAGGRLALELKRRYNSFFTKVIALSAHPGGYTLAELQEKAQWKKTWGSLLQTVPFSTFLSLWYAQPLFATFRSSAHFSSLLKEKLSTHDPHSLALFFETFTPPSFSPPIASFEATFAFGEFDLKYLELSRTLPSLARSFRIEQAGHVVHVENPKACAELIKRVYYHEPT